MKTTLPPSVVVIARRAAGRLLVKAVPMVSEKRKGARPRAIDPLDG